MGLMSGTSLDGVDGVLARFSEAEPDGRRRMCVLAHHHLAYDDTLRTQFARLNQPSDNELHRAALASNALARLYASVCESLLESTGLGPREIRAIGAHGQTVRHQPGLFDQTGYTLQLLQPALLAELTGVAVVSDFRSRDVAAGGQGAPLVPAFHAEVFGMPSPAARAILNVGGFSNVSMVQSGHPVVGFDCGPGNALIDLWTQKNLGQAFDADGAWSASGTLLPTLLRSLQSDPYFAQPVPKSTGRDHFHAGWLEGHLRPMGDVEPADVARTLTELTAWCCTDSSAQALAAGAAASPADLKQPLPCEMLVCGGGALNDFLMQRLKALWPHGPVRSTAEAGIPPMQVEASAFAWLACRHVDGLSGNLCSVTGANGPRVLGNYTPA
jgi:anhydro-N-acetylmuramic acid kinase